MQRTQCKSKKLKNTKFLDKNNEITKKNNKEKEQTQRYILICNMHKKNKKTCDIEKYQNTIKLSKHIEE
ncbi:hypothetical protein ACIUP7_004932 [Escherichia coli]